MLDNRSCHSRRSVEKKKTPWLFPHVKCNTCCIQAGQGQDMTLNAVNMIVGDGWAVGLSVSSTGIFIGHHNNRQRLQGTVPKIETIQWLQLCRGKKAVLCCQGSEVRVSRLVGVTERQQELS